MNISNVRWKKYLLYGVIMLSVTGYFDKEGWSLTGNGTEGKVQNVSETKDELNFIREIKVLPSGNNTQIIVSADRTFDAEIIIIENSKLVIDVKNARHSIISQDMPVGDNKFISKIRIGWNEPPENKVRIVADLKEQIVYDVKKGEKILTVSISPKLNKSNPDTPPKEKAGKGLLEKKVLDKPVLNEKLTEVVPLVEKGNKPAESKPAEKTPEKNISEHAAKSQEKSKSPQIKETSADQSIPSRFSGKKVSLDFQDADIINILRLLSEVSRLNMVIGENVKGKITIKMSDVPWDQALDVIMKLKGLGKVFEDNVLRIDTLANITLSQDEEVKAKDAMLRAEDLETRLIPVSYAKAKDILDSVKRNLSPRGDVTVDDRTNTLIIKDVRMKHEEILTFLKTLDKPTPQVLIEARIVQADSNFARDLGIQWGGSSSSNPGTYKLDIVSGPTGSTIGAPSTGFAVNLPAVGLAGPKGNIGFAIGKGSSMNLDLRLSAGESKGITKVLSAPKIATMDNKEATIQQGEAIPYKTLSQEGTKTEFIDATMTLKVTPKVTPDGHIIMNIKISKNRQGSIVVEGTPSINKKEATTEVLVKDGETTVIGGIFESTDVDNIGGVPWFYRIPVFGWLFRNTQKSNIKSELLIFITPKIIPVTP